MYLAFSLSQGDGYQLIADFCQSALSESVVSLSDDSARSSHKKATKTAAIVMIIAHIASAIVSSCRDPEGWVIPESTQPQARKRVTSGKDQRDEWQALNVRPSLSRDTKSGD